MEPWEGGRLAGYRVEHPNMLLCIFSSGTRLRFASFCDNNIFAYRRSFASSSLIRALLLLRRHSSALPSPYFVIFSTSRYTPPREGVLGPGICIYRGRRRWIESAVPME